MDAINPTDNPELFDEESRAGLLFVVLPILMGLAATTVGLRFYTRAVILGLIGLDDWLCLASMGTIFAFGGLALACEFPVPPRDCTRLASEEREIIKRV